MLDLFPEKHEQTFSADNSANNNQKTQKSIGMTLQMHDALVWEFGKEIVESAEISIEVITSFLNKKPNIDEQKMNEICKTLKESTQSTYTDFRPFSDNISATAFEIMQTEKEYSENNPNNIYEILQKRLNKNSTCVDLFCGKGVKKINNGSVRGAVGIFSLFGVKEALFVDLFNQTNDIEENKVDENYGYYYVFPKDKKDEAFAGKTKKRGDKICVRPEFKSFCVKLDARNTLRTMPDNSVDCIMINNVDYEIANKAGYDDLLRAEVKRVVKDKGIVLGYGTEIRPSNIDFLVQKNRGGRKLFENNK